LVRNVGVRNSYGFEQAWQGRQPLPWASEILSHLRKFLRLFRGGDVDDREEISNASAVRKGEGYFTHAVHRALHPCVHPVNPLLPYKLNIWLCRTAHFGRGVGAGWAGTTPPFAARCAQKAFRGRSSPPVREQSTFWNQR